ncbi:MULTISPECIES: hypothetical protein [Streptomyces]|uniref:Uncharacterized protein n=2 Tax=Streptomyces TaxID=1883 RepID=A0A2U9P0U9_STRAS|nr:hypothetical protein [Streptomyces actuosus]AWT42818.1 hypothetical protein DMT42_11115 [Streptomyces actuosus]MBM4820049.1 hypothetical protein [Streptomyces actuosus]
MAHLNVAAGQSTAPVTPVPDGLDESGTRLWEAVAGPFELDVHEQLILLQACRTADLLDRLARRAEGAELTVFNAKGEQVTAPWITEHRQQSLVLARLLASLRMPSGEEDERPQRRGAARGSYGVRSVAS